MTQVILERVFDPPIREDDVHAMAANGVDCFALHRVDWLGSLLAQDGRRMVCRFEGPDAESARIALRQAGVKIGRIWPGTAHEAAIPPVEPANVVVERSFAEPVELAEIQALEDAAGWCLETHRVRFVRSFFATDRKRMICLYRAPDAESVRNVQREAGMPFGDVWPFAPVIPRR